MPSANDTAASSEPTHGSALYASEGDADDSVSRELFAAVNALMALVDDARLEMEKYQVCEDGE